MSKGFVDKEEFLKEFHEKFNFDEIEGVDENDATYQIVKLCMDAFEKVVEDCPDADAEPVRHGKAVKVFNDPSTGKMFTTCTECNGKIAAKDKWCKHCGAKMDKE